jgi:hypothetical protein
VAIRGNELSQDLLAGLVGRPAQPEVAAVEPIEPRLTVEEGHHLAPLETVVTPRGQDGVARQPGDEVVTLGGQGLLGAEQIGVEGANCLEIEVPAAAPGVRAVEDGGDADVGAHDPDVAARRLLMTHGSLG